MLEDKNEKNKNDTLDNLTKTGRIFKGSEVLEVLERFYNYKPQVSYPKHFRVGDRKYHDLASTFVDAGAGKYRQCRAKWDDGITASTISIFNVTTEYERGKELLQSYRYINYNLAVDEIDWIYRKKSNNVSELKSKIWTKWADENGTIGKAYGYKIKKKVYDSKLSDNKIDQMDYILESLILDPDNRRMLINLYDVDELSEMALAPCAYETYFMVDYKDYTDPQLNMILNQRSGDFLVAAHPGGWNEFQYYVLYTLIANLTGYTKGKFVHNTYNMHIYDRHSEIIPMNTPAANISGSLPNPFVIKDEYMKQIFDIRKKYLPEKYINVSIAVAELPEEERKAYAREIIDLFYKYEIGEWFYIEEYTEKLKKIAPEIKNIPVAE